MTASILVMAKAPRAGYAKTRLEPALGPDGCAKLQAALIRHTARWATGFAKGAVYVAFAPDDGAEDIAALVPQGTQLFPQTAGDLGMRLRSAIDHVYRLRPEPLVVVATDAPTIGAAEARAAIAALASGHDACFGAALDGGYVLVALRRPEPELFDLPSERWGGPRVLALSLERAQSSGLSAVTLAAERDLDTPEDAAALAADPRVPAELAELMCPPGDVDGEDT